MHAVSHYLIGLRSLTAGLLVSGMSWLGASRVAAQLPLQANLALGSNGVILSWQTEPNGQYEVFTTTNLFEPWLPLFPDPLVSPFNLLTLPERPLDFPERFFQISRVDTIAPEIWDRSPLDRGIGVSRRHVLTVSVFDDGQIDTNSISIVISNRPPLTLADPRLSFSDGVLSYTPAPAEFLGEFGQTITASVSIADLSGNQVTNAWSFQLEPAPVLDADVLVISNAEPGLVLISTNADTFIYGFTGDSSGLVPGKILVNENPPLPYRRAVLTVAEDSNTHRVTVLTTNVTLAECLQQGSVGVTTSLADATLSAFQLTALVGAGGGGGRFGPALKSFAPAAAECCTVNFTGAHVVSNANLIASLLSGQVHFRPHLELRAVFGSQGLTGVDASLAGKLDANLLLQSIAQVPGNYTNRLALGSATKALPLDFAGPVPANAVVKLAFALVYESVWQQPGTITVGFATTNLVSTSAQLRETTWSHSGNRVLRLAVMPSDCVTNPAAQTRIYLEVQMNVELDGLAGVALVLLPTLEANSLASAPPGHIGCDLSVFESFTGILSIDPRAWDRNAPALPATTLIALEQPIDHASRTFRVGPAIQPIANMQWIPAGRFLMGAAHQSVPPPVCDCPATDVQLSGGFFIGRREVTQGEFLELLGTNPSLHHGGIWGTNLHRPVEQVSWEAATNFCRRLTLRERQARRLPFGYAYRLPTEAEWEYACRAFTTNVFNLGNQLRPGLANYDCSTDPPPACETNPVFSAIAPGSPLTAQPIAVGQFAPNPWGLHDAHGNVREWCLDWLGDHLPGGQVIDPIGMDPPMPTDTLTRAVRGGSFLDSALSCRSSGRLPLPLTTNSADLGFRLVLSTAPPEIESYSVVLQTGHTLVANQLLRADMRVTFLLPVGQSPMLVQKFNPQSGTFDTAAYDPEAGWNDPTMMTLVPGESVIVDNVGEPIVAFFSGERLLNEPPLPPFSGTRYLSRRVPEPGTYETIVGRPPVDGAIAERLVNGVIVTHTFIGGVWDPAPPVTAVGEGLIVTLPIVP